MIILNNIPLYGRSFRNNDGLWARVDGTGEGGLGDGPWNTFLGRVFQGTSTMTGYSDNAIN